MNLLILVPSSLLGGAERIAFSLAETLLRYGHRVTVCTISRGPGTVWPRLQRYDQFTLVSSAANNEKRGVLQFLCAIPKIRALGPFDIVYTTHVHTNGLASLLLRCGILNARFLVSRESTRIFDRFRGSRRAVYRAFYRLYGRQDLLIFQTDEMQQSLRENVRLPRGIVQVVLPNPVDIAQIDTARQEALNEPFDAAGSGKTPAPFRIITCGRLIPLKRVGLLLDALGLLDEKRRWRLDVLGDGPMRQELEQQAQRNGLAGRVHFHGNIANPYVCMARADLGVLCSEIEGFPNVLLEMMASGTKQIISTPCTPAVRKLPNVAISEDAAAEGLAALVARTMDRRPDHSARYRKHVEDLHSIETFAETVLAKLDPTLQL